MAAVPNPKYQPNYTAPEFDPNIYSGEVTKDKPQPQRSSGTMATPTNYYQPTPTGNNYGIAQQGGMMGGQSQYLSAQTDDARHGAQVASDKAQQDQFLQQMKGLFAAIPGSGAGGGMGMGSGGGAPSVSSPGTPQLGMVDNSAAQAAEFARAKDQAGQVAAGALKGLRSNLGSRGMLGSGLESRGTASVVNQGQQNLAGVATAQAGQNAEALQRNAEQNFQGGVAQRGQDISSQTAQRGQDLQFEEQQQALRQQLQLQQANMIMAALRGGSY